jgi:predicted glycosyltransferase
MSDRPLRIWIDLENSPHVFFFHPIIQELENRGHRVTVTARDFCNTLAIAKAVDLPVRKVGSGYEKDRDYRPKERTWRRRVSKLMAFAKGEGFDVAASHCSRTQAPAAMRLGIPTFATTDYEYSDLRAFAGVRSFMAPEAVPTKLLEKRGILRTSVRHYPGLKENVYLPHYQLDPGIRGALGVPEEAILVALRPASETAHYGNGRAELIEEAILVRLAILDRVYCVILPRTGRQRRRLSSRFRATPSVHVLQHVIDGPSLIAASDLLMSGGGTMVREAAVLGTPAVSYFDAEFSAVDRMLLGEGRLAALTTVEAAHRFRPVKKGPDAGRRAMESNLGLMVEAICDAGGAPNQTWRGRPGRPEQSQPE